MPGGAAVAAIVVSRKGHSHTSSNRHLAGEAVGEQGGEASEEGGHSHISSNKHLAGDAGRRGETKRSQGTRVRAASRGCQSWRRWCIGGHIGGSAGGKSAGRTPLPPEPGEAGGR